MHYEDLGLIDLKKEKHKSFFPAATLIGALATFDVIGMAREFISATAGIATGVGAALYGVHEWRKTKRQNQEIDAKNNYRDALMDIASKEQVHLGKMALEGPVLTNAAPIHVLGEKIHGW